MFLAVPVEGPGYVTAVSVVDASDYHDCRRLWEQRRSKLRSWGRGRRKNLKSLNTRDVITCGDNEYITGPGLSAYLFHHCGTILFATASRLYSADLDHGR
jgi:hypothetical protein